MIAAVSSLTKFRSINEEFKTQRVWAMGSKFALPNGHSCDLRRPTPLAYFETSSERWAQITFGPDFGVALTD